jgi:hypothetical protein
VILLLFDLVNKMMRIIVALKAIRAFRDRLKDLFIDDTFGSWAFGRRFVGRLADTLLGNLMFDLAV